MSNEQIKDYCFFSVTMASAAIAASYVLACTECGNSSETRSFETRNFLHNVNAVLGAGRSIRLNDVVTVLGGDDTNGVYKKISLTGSLQWQCSNRCGPGDDAAWFYPPATSVPSSGGGSSGEPSGSGGGSSAGNGAGTPTGSGGEGCTTQSTVCTSSGCEVVCYVP